MIFSCSKLSLLTLGLFCALCFALPAMAQEKDVPSQRVGLPLLLEDVYLPGPEIEPLPRKSREVPLVVRLLETKPAQDGFRYTFEVEGLDAGDYNLGDYLREISSESGTTTHQIPLRITTALPAGLPRPSDTQPEKPSRVGGYRSLVWILAILWIAGLVAIYYSGRASSAGDKAPATPPPSLAERLQPLLKKGSQGELSTEEQANLERLILAHWRKRLPELADLPASKSLTRLREHPEASPLLRKLEEWLHAPQGELSLEEQETLLAPYRN